MTMEQQLGDLLADGKITEEDAHPVRTFALYLRESLQLDRGEIMRDAWVARWSAYERGEADGPVEPESP